MELPPDAHGPKMDALWDDRVRKFAWLMACGASNAGKAAKEAGYSDSSEAAKVSAHRLMHNVVVLEAIQEASRKVLIGLAPKAIAAAQRILDDPKHSAHARILETILDRTGFFAETKHNVAVQHSVDTSELEALARRLAAENGIDVRRLLGGPMIEGEVVDAIPNEADR